MGLCQRGANGTHLLPLVGAFITFFFCSDICGVVQLDPLSSVCSTLGASSLYLGSRVNLGAWSGLQPPFSATGEEKG